MGSGFSSTETYELFWNLYWLRASGPERSYHSNASHEPWIYWCSPTKAYLNRALMERVMPLMDDRDTDQQQIGGVNLATQRSSPDPGKRQRSL